VGVGGAGIRHITTILNSTLANNGGATLTHALVNGSPALETGKSFGLTTDQRGFLRPVNSDLAAPPSNGDDSDIGAFEKQIAPAAPGAPNLDAVSDSGANSADDKTNVTTNLSFTIPGVLSGATVQLFSNVLSKFGIETSYVDGTAPSAWKSALRPRTQFLYVETPSNPLTEVFDIRSLADLAHGAGAVLVVDNCFCSPALQRPIELGADLVIHSATKYLDGQGRVLGGAIVGRRELVMDGIYGFLRTAGPSLSPFNAWVLLKGLETLRIRMEAQSQGALELARWLESHPRVRKVYYPGLASHPQHELARKQQRSGGAVVSFEVKGGREEAWKVVDSTSMISITANLGDTKTTITHPATTTHGRISPEARARAGITEGLLRVAVGLESARDIRADLERGLGG